MRFAILIAALALTAEAVKFPTKFSSRGRLAQIAANPSGNQRDNENNNRDNEHRNDDHHNWGKDDFPKDDNESLLQIRGRPNRSDGSW